MYYVNLSQEHKTFTLKDKASKDILLASLL